jgi:hypothetical protein
MRRFLRDNSLSLVFGALFLVTLAGQSFVGQRAVNADRAAHGERPLSWGGYLVSPDFAGAVLENWQSEFLQFSLFIVATVWLVQRGSNESKQPENVGLDSDAVQRVGAHAPADAPRWAKVGGLRRRLYENSLLLVMGAIFFASWAGQSLGNWRTYNEDRATHDLQAVSWLTYVRLAEFWEKTLQNWQSEFLAVGTMAVFTIYLRQRGSAESKPVGAPHHETPG